MTEPEQQGPDPSVEPLLRAERARPALDQARVASIRAAVSASLGALPVSPAAPGEAKGPAPTAAPSSALTHALTLALGLSVGAAVGWISHGAYVGDTTRSSAGEARVDAQPVDATPDPTPSPEARVEPSAPSLEDVPTQPDLAVRPVVGAPPSVPTPAIAPEPTTRGGSPVDDATEAGALAAERRLIDSARAAITADRADSALGLLETHARRHPLGALAEERDALLVEALRGAGRSSEASETARRFLSEHPSSLYAGRVRRALEQLETSAPDPGPTTP